MKILLLTTGGSHQPLLTSIAHHQPERVIFFATGKDPATSRLGSMNQVLGAGLVIFAQPTDERASLPNIPTLAELPGEAWEAIEVPADRFDECLAVMLKQIDDLASKYPEAELVADYTGGTKTMTAALASAAIECGISMSVVSGPRVDLVGVRFNERVRPVPVQRLHFRRLVSQVRIALSAHAFNTALKLLKDFDPAGDDEAEYERLLVQCQLFDAWDRFQYDEAWRHLDPMRPVFAPLLGQHLAVLQCLARVERDGIGRDWTLGLVQLTDLWRNAERRAEAGRYDDAVARWYRFMEAIVQAALQIECDIRTADVPADRGLPESLLPPLAHDGTRPAGLFMSYRILCALEPRHVISKMFENHQNALRDLISFRNLSLLAHGNSPVDRPTWQRVQAFVVKAVWPVLETIAAKQKTRLSEPWPGLPLGTTFHGAPRPSTRGD